MDGFHGIVMGSGCVKLEEVSIVEVHRESSLDCVTFRNLLRASIWGEKIPHVFLENRLSVGDWQLQIKQSENS